MWIVFCLPVWQVLRVATLVTDAGRCRCPHARTHGCTPSHQQWHLIRILGIQSRVSRCSGITGWMLTKVAAVCRPAPSWDHRLMWQEGIRADASSPRPELHPRHRGQRRAEIKRIWRDAGLARWQLMKSAAATEIKTGGREGKGCGEVTPFRCCGTGWNTGCSKLKRASWRKESYDRRRISQIWQVSFQCESGKGHTENRKKHFLIRKSYPSYWRNQ